MRALKRQDTIGTQPRAVRYDKGQDKDKATQDKIRKRGQRKGKNIKLVIAVSLWLCLRLCCLLCLVLVCLYLCICLFGSCVSVFVTSVHVRVFESVSVCLCVLGFLSFSLPFLVFLTFHAIYFFIGQYYCQVFEI
jgi:hypothetical protein